MRANQVQSNNDIIDQEGYSPILRCKAVQLKHMDGRIYKGHITSDAHHYLQMNDVEVPHYENDDNKYNFDVEVISSTRSIAQVNVYSTETKSISQPEVAYRMELNIPENIYNYIKQNNLYIVPDNGKVIAESEHSVFKITAASEMHSFKPQFDYEDGLTPQREITALVQSLYSLATEAKATFSLINDDRNEQIAQIELITDKEFMLSSIEGRGSISGEEFQDIDFTSPTYMAPFRVKVAGTKDKVELYSDWLDYSLTLPLNEVMKLDKLQLVKYFASNPAAPTALEKSVGVLVADMIKFTQAYLTNFTAFRYTKAEWDKLSDKEKEHIAPNTIKADATIAGIYLTGTVTKEPMAAVDMLVNQWKNKHPEYQIRGSSEWEIFDKAKRFIASISNVIKSEWAVGGGVTEYHRALQPWFAQTPSVDTSTTETSLFSMGSQYFEKVGNTINTLPSAIQLSRLKLYEADTTISDPVMPAQLTAQDIKNKAKNINVGTDKDLGYLVYIPFKDKESLTNFYIATEKSETKTVTVNGTRPNTKWYVFEDPGPYDDFGLPVNNMHNGVPVEVSLHVGPVEWIQNLEIEILKGLGYTYPNKPVGWTFSYSKASDKLNVKVSSMFDGTTSSSIYPAEAFRFESITYSYDKTITKGILQRKQVVFDKYNWGKQVQGFVNSKPTWIFIPQSDTTVINYLSINGIFSGKYELKLTYAGGGEISLPMYPSNAVYDERITQDTIVL